MPIEIPERPSNAIAAALPPGTRLQRGQARPLTGAEIAQCVERTLVEALRSIDRDQALEEYFAKMVRERLDREAWARVQHLTWPSVRWLVRVYRSDSGVWADAAVQLSEATKVVIYVGEIYGEPLKTAELGQEKTDVPDDIRERWGLGRLIEYTGPNGERGTVTVGATDRPRRDLPGPHIPAPPIAARSVDVGRAAEPAEPARLSDAELLGEPPAAPQAPAKGAGEASARPQVIVKEKI